MYVPLQMVQFWLRFGLKTVIDFAHFALELYTGLLGHYGSVRMCSLLQLSINKKETFLVMLLHLYLSNDYHQRKHKPGGTCPPIPRSIPSPRN